METAHFNFWNGSQKRKINKKALAVLIHDQSGRPEKGNPVMKNQDRIHRNGGKTPTVPQAATIDLSAPQNPPPDVVLVLKNHKGRTLTKIPIPVAVWEMMEEARLEKKQTVKEFIQDAVLERLRRIEMALPAVGKGGAR